jgi:glycosyltransferase involved in cell wall biosynthesis
VHTTTVDAQRATEGLPPGATVLQVLPALGHGGVERGTLEMAEAIVRAGGRALVASAGGPNVAQLERAGARHLSLPLATKNPLAMVANAIRLAQVVRREGVAIVHARSRAPAWSARWAARRTGVPFVTTYHGTYNENFPLKRGYNAIMASGDRVIAISHFIADRIVERHGTPADRIRVIHRGADLRRFQPEAVGAGRLVEMHRRWRIRDDARIVLLPGRLTRWKGQAVLVEAAARLEASPEHADVVVVLAGDTDGHAAYAAELLALAERLGLPPGRVVLPGHCADMPAALMLAEVVVSASIEPEGFGRVMAEAGAMGKPVVATAIGAAPEIVVPGETGWLVPPGDPAALATALAAALTLAGPDRVDLATAARARMRERFSVETMCAKTLAIYRELLIP